MRTTLTIDDDVLQAAKEMAADSEQTVGEVISALARRSLISAAPKLERRNGVPLLVVQPGARIATMEIVNKLRDELP
jgi:hypothetical protein